jgi:hypothetical protein
MKALDYIISHEKSKEQGKDKKEEIISPLLVLEILKKQKPNQPNLKFSVIKQYLLNRLEVQDRIIRKNTA